MKEQDGYGRLWQIELVESIEIDARMYAGDSLGGVGEEP